MTAGMGRLMRIIDKGLIYHAINRGNNRGGVQGGFEEPIIPKSRLSLRFFLFSRQRSTTAPPHSTARNDSASGPGHSQFVSLTNRDGQRSRVPGMLEIVNWLGRESVVDREEFCSEHSA